MRVIQLLTTLAFGDAVSNDCLAIDGLLKKNGYASEIFAEYIDDRLPKNVAREARFLTDIKPEDVILYHLSTGTKLNEWIKTVNCRKFCLYHNITPGHYFSDYNGKLACLCSDGRDQVKSLNSTFDAVLGVSSYNCQDLKDFGYTCPMFVKAILIPFEDYKKEPNEEVIRKYSDGYKNIVFVGRIVPNKCQHDVVTLLAYYKKMFPDEKIRVIFVGSDNGAGRYSERIRNYANNLGVSDDLILTGQVPFKDILAYYKLADCFVSMSEHEGFCVPLVEAMYFDSPIVAFDSSAIGETLGGSGVLLETKDMEKAAFAVHEVVNDKELREKIIEGQRKRLNDFSYENISKLFMSHFENVLKLTEGKK